MSLRTAIIIIKTSISKTMLSNYWQSHVNSYTHEWPSRHKDWAERVLSVSRSCSYSVNL